MKIWQDISLSNFKFWSGAKERAEKLTTEQLDTIESMLEDTPPEGGWTDTAINDLFWFDFDTVVSWLGYEDEEHFDADVKTDDVEEAEDWFGRIEEADELIGIAHLSKSGLIYDEDGVVDFDKVYDLAQSWWDGLSDIEKVETMRNTPEF